MATVEERLDDRPGQDGWGIQPIPMDSRTLGAFDLSILWGDLGIGLLVMVTGALLVPALGFWVALSAIALGSLIGVGLLAMAGAAGAEHGVPTMVLLRPVLGIRGSWAPSVLNVIQLIGWTAVELWAMSFVADVISQRVFGFSARWLWLGLTAVLCTWLALWGPVGVARVWMKRFAAWLIVAISLIVTIVVLTHDGIFDAMAAPGAGGWPTFGSGLDLVIAMPVSWLPLVADYTRFGRSSRSAFTGTFWGYLIANIWLYALGALLVLGTGTEPSPAGIATGILSLTGGSIAGLVFLAGLLAGETDEAFADIYSGAVSTQNIWPRLSQRAIAIAIAVVSAGLAAWLTMERYENFLFLLGSIFVPLFGILAGDHFLIRRGRLSIPDLYREGGAYWFHGGVRLGALVPWLLGFLIYHWIAPIGPDWWTGPVGDLLGTPLSQRLPWLSASLPSFVAAFATSLLLPRAPISSSQPAGTVPREGE